MTDWRQLYIEPFLFSGSMMFNITCKSILANDINGELMNFWTMMLGKDTRAEFAEKIAPIWISDLWYQKLVELVAETEDPVYRAILFYMRNKLSFSGIPTEHFKYKLWVPTFEKDFSLWQQIIDEKHSFATWSLDFHEFYEQHLLKQRGGGNGRLRYYVYSDCPYVIAGKNYQFSFTEQDHRDLAAFHAQLAQDPNWMLIISYDDHPLVRELYPESEGWHVMEVSWKTTAKARKTADYHELLISNREFHRYPHTPAKAKTLTEF